MYSVSAEFKTAMLQPVIQSKVSGVVDGVVFTEDDILSGSLRIISQNSQQDEINIGVAASSELEITFLHALGLVRTALRGKSIVLTYQMLVGATYENVPLGTYYIDEANWTLSGIHCKAYDAMTAFDTEIDPDEVLPTMGKAYDFLTWACSKCGVTLGMTQADVESLTNGSVQIWFPDENPAKTYREYIAYLAGVTCSFAMISRDEKLVLKQYDRLPVATYTDTDRITGASFSDFETRYNAFYVQDVVTNENQKYKNTGYVGLTMDLGPNPFMQVLPSREGLRYGVLAGLSSIMFEPYDVKLNIPPIHDLGDCLMFTGGIGDNTYHTINYIAWTYGRQLALAGYGKNPATAAALSKADLAAQNNQTAIASLTKKINSITTNGLVFLLPYIVSEDPIADGNRHTAVIFAFEVQEEKNPIAVHALFEADVETGYDSEEEEYADCRMNYTITLDGEDVKDWAEVIFTDGDHVLNIDIILPEVLQGEHELTIDLKPEGGDVR